MHSFSHQYTPLKPGRSRRGTRSLSFESSSLAPWAAEKNTTKFSSGNPLANVTCSHKKYGHFFLEKMVDPPWKIMDSLNLSLKGDNYQLRFRLICPLPRGTCRFLKFVMSRYAMAIPPKHEMPPWPFGRTCCIHKTQRSLTQKITW